MPLYYSGKLHDVGAWLITARCTGRWCAFCGLSSHAILSSGLSYVPLDYVGAASLAGGFVAAAAACRAGLAVRMLHLSWALFAIVVLSETGSMLITATNAGTAASCVSPAGVHKGAIHADALDCGALTMAH